MQNIDITYYSKLVPCYCLCFKYSVDFSVTEILHIRNVHVDVIAASV